MCERLPDWDSPRAWQPLGQHIEAMHSYRSIPRTEGGPIRPL